MIRTLLVASAVFIMAPIGAAVVVTTTVNYIDILGLGARALPITDGTGTVLPVGSFSIVVGTFASGTDFLLDPASLITAFQRNGATDGASSPVFEGFFNFTFQDTSTSTDGNDPFTANPIFVVIGDAPIFASSTDIIVVDVGVAWPKEVPLLGATVGIDIGDSGANVVRGVTTTVSGASGPFTQFNGGPGVTFIPELSPTLLAGFAGLALLIRRRR